MGEKILVPNVARIEGTHVSAYLHRTATDLPPTIGVLVALDKADDALGKDIAMHTAAMSPTFSPATRSRPRRSSPSAASPRRPRARRRSPRPRCPKIIEGRVNSFFKDNVLLEQPFAKDQKVTITKLLADAGAR